MNDEENSFDRSNEESRDASELHSFGGMKDESPEETPKSENEELADAIEELESDEVENSMPEDKVEEPIEEPAEEKPAFKMDDEPVEEPKKEEPIMTIDSVKEPKAKSDAKGGAGWKVATFLFAVLAVLGCGGLCYLMFVDGTTNILGRTITSSQTKPVVPNKPAGPDTPDDVPEPEEISYKNGVFSMPDWGVKLKLSGAKYLSYKYDEDAETISFWLVDPATAATLSEKPVIADNVKNPRAIGMLKLTKELDNGEYGSAPELVYTLENGGGYIYYYSPQDFGCNYVDEAIKEQSCSIEGAAIDYFRTAVKTSVNFEETE